MTRGHSLTTKDVDQASRIADISAQIANAPSRSKRFLAAVGLACDLSLDNSPEGFDEAVEQALDCLQREDEEDQVEGLEALKMEDCATFNLEPQFPDSELLRLLVKITLAHDSQARFQALEWVVRTVASGREHAAQLACIVMAHKNGALRLH